MNEKDWKIVKEIFLEALTKNGGERDEYLTEVCGGNATVRAEVESLLAENALVEDFIEEPLFQPRALFTNGANHAEKHFGNYKILREIGAGGMGAVFLATRDDGEFEQQVAIKIIRQTIAERALVERFKRERQILANLNHPNIARLLDGGVSREGEPFLAMEFVEGEAITDFAKRAELNLEERLKLFLKVCAAVSYAHRNLIVHRDLKPSNIIVTKANEPKLLDFGLAKLLDEADAAQTQTAFRALTPAYASPEQLKGASVTTASDIYSLGVIFYELLTGRRPFHFEGKSLREIIETATEIEAPAPSMAIADLGFGIADLSGKEKSKSKLIRNRRWKTNPKSEIPNPQLKGDLDNIALTALRKEPERRYNSVEAFAGDIEKYLKGLPIAARANTFSYRAAKFIKRHKVGVLAATLILLSLIGGIVVSIWQARVAARERDQAQQARAKAEQINAFLQNILSAASPEEKGKDATVIEVLNDAVQKIETDFADQPEMKAQALLTIGQTYDKLDLTDEAEKTLRVALQLNTELYGDENKATDLCRIYLGDVVSNQGKFDEAEQLLTRAIETERKISPAENKELASALFILGELYARKRTLDKAKSLLKESVVISDKLDGENNPDSAYTLISLGRAQMFAGDLDDAEATFRQSVEIHRRLPAKYEVRLGYALANLGRLLVTKKNYAEGIGFIGEAYDIFLRKQGESFATFEAKAYIIMAYFAKEDYSKVIAEGRETIASGRRLKLENLADFMTTLENVGLALTRTGKAQDGEPFLREAIKIRTASPDEENIGLAVLKSSLGECLTAQKRYEEAETLLTESYENLKNSQGADNPRTLLAKARLDELDKSRK